MIPIRKRISRPFLVLIMLIPIAILLVFNGIVSAYIHGQAEQDLNQAVSQITTQLESVGNTTASKFPNLPTDMRVSPNGNENNILSIIRNQKHSTSAELVVFTRTGSLSKIFNDQNFVSKGLADEIYQTVETLPLGEMECIPYKGDDYYIIEVDYDGQAMTEKMVYVTQGLVLDEFITAVNVMLLLVSAVITGIALLVSTRVTNAIAMPIERLTALVETMQSDELLVIDDKSENLELHRLTAEINALNRRIYEYNTAQKSFLHNASHELRTPLMSIQGYADGIEMGVFPDYQGTAHLISDQSKRLTKLVDGLLTLARVESFHTNKKLTRINLSDSLQELLNGYYGYATQQQIALQTTISPDVWALANDELLSSAVGNLLSNAIRYAKTAVRISLQMQGEHTVITVQDDGNGISDVEQIFDKFMKGEDGNFGLGLSIAKSSVQMLHGKMRVWNDGGAVFEILI